MIDVRSLPKDHRHFRDFREFDELGGRSHIRYPCEKFALLGTSIDIFSSMEHFLVICSFTE